jgi:hypothetical protein
LEVDMEVSATSSQNAAALTANQPPPNNAVRQRDAAGAKAGHVHHRHHRGPNQSASTSTATPGQTVGTTVDIDA